jgi:transposase
VEWTVAIGVDTHREAHVAVAVDRLGQRLGALEFRVDERGFAELRRFALALGEPAFAIEGTGSYGASLARALLADGFAVFECERPRRRRRTDKNDVLDAEVAARRLLTGEPLSLPRGGQEREQLRLLLLERRSAQHARQQALNQLKAAIVTLDPPLRAQLEQRSPATLARSKLLQRQQLAPLQRLARRIVLLESELSEIDRELRELTRALCPKLLSQPGVGPICAAQLLVSTAAPERIRTEPAFAALAGVSPVEASSGPNKRHRLNRSGDRQLNWARRRIAASQLLRIAPLPRRIARQ